MNILKLILRLRYGVRGALPPPVGPPPAFTGMRWPWWKMALYRTRKRWHDFVSPLYAKSGLPDEWAQHFRL